MDDKDEKNKGDEKLRITDFVKDFTANSFNSLFMSEDSLLNYLKDKKLPRELVTPALEIFSKKREEFYGLLVKEFGKVLSKVDVTKEITRFLESHHINFQAKISFEAKDAKDATGKKES